MKLAISNGNIIKDIEDWFGARCDDDWEHSYGISIETTDNPGWYVEIDLKETSWEGRDTPFSRSVRSDSNWIQFGISDGKFIGSGGVNNLSELLRNFLLIVK